LTEVLPLSAFLLFIRVQILFLESEEAPEPAPAESAAEKEERQGIVTFSPPSSRIKLVD